MDLETCIPWLLIIGIAYAFIDHMYKDNQKKKYLYYKKKYTNRPFSEGDEITTKVVGVTFYDRQTTIKHLSAHNKIYIQRDYDNSHDHNAIKVYTYNDQHLRKTIGYINRKLAGKIAPFFDKHNHQPVGPIIVKGHIVSLNETYGKPTIGLTICFKIPSDKDYEEAWNEYQRMDEFYWRWH